jgi:C4-dicarboxylate-specific signal transduction histidine kinase
MPFRLESRLGWFVLCFGLILLVAAADYATGYEVSLAVLYLAPVMIAAWVLGLRSGLVVAVLGTAAWYVTFAGSNPYSHPLYYGWEALVRASTAVVFAVVIDQLRLALARSDERFVTVLEGLDAAVYVADNRTGELLYVNERCRAAFGADLNALADIVDRFDMHEPSAASAGVTDEQREVQDRVSGEWYLVNQRSVRWVDGRSVTLHVATDTTQRKQMERLAQDRQDKLEMTSRFITAGEMASTLAHELNQPLASILNYNTGCAQLLQSGTATTAEVLEGLEKSSEQAERAGAILQQVRNFIARQEPQFSPCDLGELLGEAARLIAAQASRHAVHVDVDGLAEPVLVEVDRVMLQQLVLNLAKNAIEAMENTAPEQRRLTIRWRCVDGSVDVQVADRGVGIPAELAHGLFIPFFSTKRGGMGLGLHICRSIAEYHDGRLWASENPGGGTVFHFSFPARRA